MSEAELRARTAARRHPERCSPRSATHTATGWYMTPPVTSCSTPTCRCGTVSIICLPRSPASASAVARNLSSPGVPVAALIKANCSGRRLHWRVLQVLHNPRYAGIASVGPIAAPSSAVLSRSGSCPASSGPCSWQTGSHPGYITVEQYEANLRQLRDNAHAHGVERRKSPPREGPALLQGLVICGVCGRRMTVRYHFRNGRQAPQYVCQREAIGDPQMPAEIDRAIGELLLDGLASDHRGGLAGSCRTDTHPRSRWPAPPTGPAGALRR